MGIILSVMGKPTESLEEYQKALAIRQKLVDANPADPEFQTQLARVRERRWLAAVNHGAVAQPASRTVGLFAGELPGGERRDPGLGDAQLEEPLASPFAVGSQCECGLIRLDGQRPDPGSCGGVSQSPAWLRISRTPADLEGELADQGRPLLDLPAADQGFAGLVFQAERGLDRAEQVERFEVVRRKPEAPARASAKRLPRLMFAEMHASPE